MGFLTTLNARELTFSAVRQDDIAVCQIIKDAARAGFSWSDAPAPDFPYRRVRAVYASLVELLAWRNGDEPPAWTADVGSAPSPIFLVRCVRQPRWFRLMLQTPEQLVKRNIFAVPDYLDLKPWLKGPRSADTSVVVPASPPVPIRLLEMPSARDAQRFAKAMRGRGHQIFIRRVANAPVLPMRSPTEDDPPETFETLRLCEIAAPESVVASVLAELQLAGVTT